MVNIEDTVLDVNVNVYIVSPQYSLQVRLLGCATSSLVLELTLMYYCVRTGDNQSVGSSVPVVSRWLSPVNRIFYKWLAWWLPGR